MTKIFKISTIIFVLLVICAPSCEDEKETANREEAILTATKNDVREEFATEYLTEASLFAYEVTAKQKLSDFADYLQIMTDTSLDMSFRIKAGEMIKKTFQSENVSLRLDKEEKESEPEFEVHRLIKDGLENKLKLPLFSVDSIIIHEPLHRIGNTTYSGILRFSQNFTDPFQPGIIINSIRRCTDVYVVKEDKIFGTDTLKIWSVRLGEIR
jgi:predicted transposase YbfD/YdcC